MQYVARSKGAREEWKIARDNLLESEVPAFVADLQAELLKALDTPGPAKKVRQNKASKYTSLDLEG